MISIVGNYGRLGNKLWTYTNVLAFCYEHNINLCNTTFNENFIDEKIETDISKVTIKSQSIKKIATLLHKINLKIRVFKYISIGEHSLLDLDKNKNKILNISKNNHIFFSGFYFKAAESVKKNYRPIKEFFSPNNEIKTIIDKSLEVARNKSNLLIGVHIRHGDYKHFCNGIMYFEAEEYARVMSEIAKANQNLKISFLICSDEAQELKKFNGLNVLQSHESPIVDIFTLSKCDLIIGPYSTFSQWASFYGNTPLHILGRDTEDVMNRTAPLKIPDLYKDFEVFSPDNFGKYSRSNYELE